MSPLQIVCLSTTILELSTLFFNTYFLFIPLKSVMRQKIVIICKKVQSEIIPTAAYAFLRIKKCPSGIPTGAGCNYALGAEEAVVDSPVESSDESSPLIIFSIAWIIAIKMPIFAKGFKTLRNILRNQLPITVTSKKNILLQLRLYHILLTKSRQKMQEFIQFYFSFPYVFSVPY